MASEQPALVYDRIDENRRDTFLLMLAFVALLAGMSIAIGVILGLPYPYAPVLILPFLLFALFSYYSSSGVALAISQAHPVTKEEEPELFRTVENLCIGAGLPMPQVYVIEDSSPNAFATGRDPQHAAVAVTSGMLQMMNREELQGVVAHEMSHIRNLDVRYSMLVAVLVGTIVVVTDLFFQGTLRMILNGSWARVRGKNALQAAVALLVFMLFLLLVAAILRLFAPLAALGVQAAVSRQREFLADATAVDLGRNPVSLENALAKIASADDRMTGANRAITHLYFVHPTFSDADALHEGSAAGWRGIFSTHPSILDRVNRLRTLAGESPLVGPEADQLAVEA